MRVVRCDACGAKAMIAAGQCPKCSHLFELRDGFGELLPLAYCSSCESYYPETVGQCKWCGTKPERPPILPQVLRGVAAAGVVAIVGTAWLVHDRVPRDTRSLKRAAVAKSMPAPAAQTVDTAPPPPAIAVQPIVAKIDSAAASVSVVARDTSAVPDTIVPVEDIVVPVVPRVTVAGRDAAPPPVTGVASKPPSAKPAPTAPSTPRRSVRWVRSVSRDWVVVRARASKNSRIVASIGPRSRVELGETVGSWRRIRAKGFNGWVEPRNSFVIAGAR